jgi:threonine synthase
LVKELIDWMTCERARLSRHNEVAKAEDGCLWIYGTSDQPTIAFTDRGMEYLQELLAEHKRSKASPRP